MCYKMGGTYSKMPTSHEKVKISVRDRERERERDMCNDVTHREREREIERGVNGVFRAEVVVVSYRRK